jgi:multiple antibiotic resistance protein
LAITFFLVANPIGNSPAIVALIKNFDFERQKKIMLREALIALSIALFFQYFGEGFLNLLRIQDYSLTIGGGVILFLTSLSMVFPKNEIATATSAKTEPFIVPIATPLITGGGLLSMIMLYSKSENDHIKISLSILLAWVGVTLVLVAAPYLQKILGQKGLLALEQLMGMILSLISMSMIVKGLGMFVNSILS